MPKAFIPPRLLRAFCTAGLVPFLTALAILLYIATLFLSWSFTLQASFTASTFGFRQSSSQRSISPWSWLTMRLQPASPLFLRRDDLRRLLLLLRLLPAPSAAATARSRSR